MHTDSEIPNRRIAHVDMDAFFASCELTQYPELKGLPMVVGGRSRHAPIQRPDGLLEFYRLRDYQGRGVLTTATYEARALDVHSGMSTSKAARLAPQAILLPVSFELYRHYSRLFKQAVANVSPIIQDVGIDELYVDLTELPQDSFSLVKAIKGEIQSSTGLTCSVGVSPNKLLSKIASDLNKPDGYTILNMQDVPHVIWPLSVSKINGIGPKARDRLKALAIDTIGDLAHADIGVLQDHFGVQYAKWLNQVAHGLDERPLVTESEPKGLSREVTFERDFHPKRDRQALGQAFNALCEKVAQDLDRKGYRGKSIGIKLRFDNFQTVTRAITLKVATSNASEIRAAASQCLKRVKIDHSIRLLGVRVGALESQSSLRAEQLDLF